MGVEQNLIQFAQGKRYEETDVLCPQCKESNLQWDKMSSNDNSELGRTYECFQCGYKTNKL